ncbi:MAG: hypothetical protein OEQ39_20690 [Gammaproteobacteria bacterium]|nr:hypothetical protein [Gammaproteobacteria bacterium]
MEVDKQELEKILEGIERQLRTVTGAEQAYWKLSPDEQARLPKQVRHHFESSSG